MATTEVATRPNQPLRPFRRRAGGAPAEGGPEWPSFKGAAKRIGTSAKGVTVYVDDALGAEAEQNAKDLLAAADDVVRQNNTIFAIDGGAVDVIVCALNGPTDGTGGADHDGCDFDVGRAIEVDAAYGNSTRVIALFEAELSECAMNKRLCGLSTGEALSRWCAAAIGANALADFATAPQWAQSGMPNWVDHTAQSDQEADSIGCGMAFLSWLLDSGHTLSEIAQAMVALGDGGTLAALYAQLSGKPAMQAWDSFSAAVDVLANGITSDDPFDALPHVHV